MEEQRRRQYLQALGIPLWMPRPEYWSASADDEALVRNPIAEPTEQAAAQPLLAMPDNVQASEPPVLAASVVEPPEDWDGLRQRVVACRACVLAESRTQTVFGVGNLQARLLVIGEAPGVDEDRQGEPFVGRAGQLLNAMLRAMGYPREQVYIANILKCRPPGNRDPLPAEALHCWPFLRQQIQWVRPRLILAVGRIAAQNLLHTQVAVGELRGHIHRLPELDIPVVVTYHPAYLLRSPEHKGRAWTDLKLALRILDAAPPDG